MLFLYKYGTYAADGSEDIQSHPSEQSQHSPSTGCNVVVHHVVHVSFYIELYQITLQNF